MWSCTEWCSNLHFSFESIVFQKLSCNTLTLFCSTGCAPVHAESIFAIIESFFPMQRVPVDSASSYPCKITKTPIPHPFITNTVPFYLCVLKSVQQPSKLTPATPKTPHIYHSCLPVFISSFFFEIQMHPLEQVRPAPAGPAGPAATLSGSVIPGVTLVTHYWPHPFTGSPHSPHAREAFPHDKPYRHQHRPSRQEVVAPVCNVPIFESFEGSRELGEALLTFENILSVWCTRVHCCELRSSYMGHSSAV